MKPAIGRPGRPPRTCTVCGRNIRKTDNANLRERLCFEHDRQRREIKSADQRRKRSGTTALPVRLSPIEAHWLLDVWKKVRDAAANVREQDPDDDGVKELLAAVAGLRKELGPALKPVENILDLRPSGKPPKDWTPPKRANKPS